MLWCNNDRFLRWCANWQKYKDRNQRCDLTFSVVRCSHVASVPQRQCGATAVNVLSLCVCLRGWALHIFVSLKLITSMCRVCVHKKKRVHGERLQLIHWLTDWGERLGMCMGLISIHSGSNTSLTPHHLFKSLQTNCQWYASIAISVSLPALHHFVYALWVSHILWSKMEN